MNLTEQGDTPHRPCPNGGAGVLTEVTVGAGWGRNWPRRVWPGGAHEPRGASSRGKHGVCVSRRGARSVLKQWP